MFGKGTLSKVEEEEADVYLNVTPMIDVLTTLLFFLLLSFGAVIVALINTTYPALSEGTDQPDLSKTKITVSLAITEKGFILSATSEGLSDEELDKLKKTFTMTADGYDYQGLNDYMFDLKQRFKDSESVAITPDPDIPYEVLIKTLDSSREREVRIDGKPKRIPLFPSAVIAPTVR